jgi:hypothetical protein
MVNPSESTLDMPPDTRMDTPKESKPRKLVDFSRDNPREPTVSNAGSYYEGQAYRILGDQPTGSKSETPNFQ